MDSNPWGLGALVLGVATWLLWLIGTCMGLIIPFLGSLVYPICWLLALAGVIVGFVGYRTAMVTDGAGRGASLGGLALSLSWLVLNVVLLLLGLLIVGSAFALIFVGILAEMAR